jgi:hypothetical protein
MVRKLLVLVAATCALGVTGIVHAASNKSKPPPRSSGGAAGGIVSEGQGYGVFIGGTTAAGKKAASRSKNTR